MAITDWPIEDWALPKVLAARARSSPDRPYLDMPGAPPLTFGAIEHRSRVIANGLQALGVGFGDRVLVLLPTCVEFIETWFAVNRLGAVLVPINTAYRGAFLRHVASDAAARIIVAGAAFLGALADIEDSLPDLRTVVVVGDGTPRFARLEAIDFAALRAAPERGIDVAVSVQDTGAILYTSGTTGRSKGAVLPHGHLFLDPRVYIDELGLGAADVMYTCLPLFHANALLLSAYGGLILGCRVAFAPRFSASAWLDDIRRSGATVTNLLGVMTEFIFRQAPRAEDTDNALRIATAVPISPQLGRPFEARFGVQLLELYGSTELNCPIFQPRDATRRNGSCGRAVDRWFECRLADPANDLPVAPGAPGELLVRPRQPWTISTGYHNMPAETAAAWRNLWFHTGDVFRQDVDGFYYFVDRLKDAIRRRGENVSSFEVEEIVRSHPDVAEVAVVGIRSPYDAQEQEVKACIVLRDGAVADAPGIAAHCAALLPDFAMPRFIEFFNALPKTPTLKLRKQDLRAQGVTAATWISPHAARRGV